MPSSHDTRPQHAPAGLGELVVTDGRDLLLGSVAGTRCRTGRTGLHRVQHRDLAAAGGAGSGHGSRAQRMLADYLFTTFPVHRVEASTDVTNLREQRSLEKAGFSREGLLRGAQWRSGAYHDLVSYACLRGEAER